MTTATDFQNMRRPALIPADAALPPQVYGYDMIAGQAPPVLPHRALTVASTPNLDHLPPISSLYRRPFTTLTTG